LAIVVDMITTTFFLPVFSHHLIQTFGLSIEQASFFFIINILSYFTVLHYLNEVNNILGVKFTMTVGLLINSIGVLLIHPVGFFPQ
jgi:fucose permease